ncbi:KAP family P-loop NTPase fold protein [Fusobacterium mortiferum]|uniref:KAP NTPase domain-containing protein n=1 Tax=Fusobacterium mortiferum TaxID=850 RepID=A0ABS2G5C9_FUSMR|nr:P-loop NTPase fold protein [Fusobacterium mortiferum]MBM6875914.1 hypothetical protein [Fusobacterium mortiferum]
MKHYEKLTKKRKAFIEQLYNLINTQFEEQKKLIELESLKKVKKQKEKIKLIIEELENNSDYIQRIFIDAPWGMGKTYFAKSLEELISYRNLERRNSNVREIKFITINAWETDYFSDPMKSIIGEIVENISLSDNIIEKVDELIDTKSKKIMQFFANFGLDKIGVNEERKDELKDIFFNSTSVDISNIKEYIQYKKTVKSFKEALSRSTSLKVILIDELDRCKPNYAIELLETVKHFFGVKNLIFIFLVNKKQLKESIGKTDDNCTEYFEKFFDIQFKLPELEYEDFIEIEYNKYNNIRIDYVADDVNSFYEFLFLEAFKSNCDSSVVSPRNLIKSFKKFRLLLSSLSLKEKGCYPLMIVLVLYFIREEFLIKNNTKNNFKILDLFSKTFFNQNILKKDNNSNDIEDNFYEYFSVKKLFYNFQDFYKTLYFILYYPSGKESVDRKYSNIVEYRIYFSTLEKTPSRQVILSLNDINISNKNIFYYLFYNQYNKMYFYLDDNILEDIYIQKSTIKNKYISSNIMEIWAKDKYEFILLQQSKENN